MHSYQFWFLGINPHNSILTSGGQQVADAIFRNAKFLHTVIILAALYIFSLENDHIKVLPRRHKLSYMGPSRSTGVRDQPNVRH